MPTDKAYIISKLEKIGNYLELLGENPFKTRAYFRGAEALEAADDDAETLIRTGRLGQMEGIGAALREKIEDLYHTGTCDLLGRLEEQVPDGVGEMLEIKGLGPKKVAHIWQKMGLTSAGELLYACQENRLAQEKGFGEKTQENIRRAIEFWQSQAGLYHYYRVKEWADAFREFLDVKEGNFEETGDLRRCVPVLTCGEFLADESLRAHVRNALKHAKDFVLESEGDEGWQIGIRDAALKLYLRFCEGNFFREWLMTTGNAEHLRQLGEIPKGSFHSEAAIYSRLDMQYVEPELREGRNETALARKHKLPGLVALSDLKGILHNHSTWSDGIHTIEEMARACRDLGMQYLGISDHSQTAVYANGLSEGRLEQQSYEIDKLNGKLAPFRILKGIESDILTDGSLDYPSHILSTLDFVVASVHSGFKMTEEKATERIIRAVENPFTHILGHPTGRLLLSREGYPLDHKKVIDACAANGVSIEINANPYRLDLDWTWIPYAMEKGVMISVNPDAHKKEALMDIRWGVAAARKGMLTAHMTLNALPLKELLAFFEKRKTYA